MIKTSNKISYPVTLLEAQSVLRIDPSEGNNDLITLDYQAATQDVEILIGKDIALTDNSINEFSFTGSTYTVLEGNLVGILGVYVDDVSVGYNLKTIDDGNFKIELNSNVSDVKLTISYRSGYLDGKCPQNLKKLILRMTKDNYDIEDQSYIESNMKENLNSRSRVVNGFRKINF